MRYIGQTGRTNPDLKNTYKKSEQKKLKICPKTLDTGHTNGTTGDKLEIPNVKN
jgi:hypothetical protein